MLPANQAVIAAKKSGRLKLGPTFSSEVVPMPGPDR
jgi:hypothetical protein